MNDRQREIALFRYTLVREAADAALTKAERGALVRDLASRHHIGPGGLRTRVARNTIDRWIRAYRAGGFDALAPAPRSCEPKTPAAVLALAEALSARSPGAPPPMSERSSPPRRAGRPRSARCSGCSCAWA